MSIENNPASETNKWIKTADELPPFNHVVLVWNGWAVMQGCLLSQANGLRYYSIDTVRVGKFKIFREEYEKITHWMPMMELPKCQK